MTTTIELVDSVSPPDTDIIERGLIAHAKLMAIEPRNARQLGVVARDAHGVVVGGLIANTVWGWLQIKELWVGEALRGGGLGKELMEQAEQEARRRGCHHALVDTFDFQARPFYEQLGYRSFGELEDFPRGHRRFFLSKALSTFSPDAQRKNHDDE